MSALNPVFILSILLALSVHEAAHAFVSNWLGDPTAKEQGRMTLNPLAHLDWLGTLLFLTVHFGWGKPVPIDPRYFRHPKRDQALTAIAGPTSNLLLAFAVFALFLILSPVPSSLSVEDLLSVLPGGPPWRIFLTQFLVSSLFLNLGLMAFNLLPVAPLDGSKVLQAFVPLRYEDSYEEFMRRGPFLLLFLLVAERLLNFPFLSTWILWLMQGVLSMFFFLAGLLV